MPAAYRYFLRAVAIVTIAPAFCLGAGGRDARATPSAAAPKAKCAAGDPNVYLNAKSKRYVPDTPSNLAIIKQHGGVAGDVTSGCTSQAKRLGAQLMSPVQLKRMGHP